MKKYLICFSLTTLSLLVLGAAINAWIDPLWLFQHNNALNRFQFGMDTRKQKAHRLFFGNATYDALLLGSSRLVAVNPDYFVHERVFNGAVEAMQHWDFLHHLDFFVKAKGVPKRLYLGVDFLDAFSSPPPQARQVEWQTLESPIYRPRMLLSFDALRYALRAASYNYRHQSFSGDRFMYARAGYQLDHLFSTEEAQRRRLRDLAAFKKKLQTRHYQGAMLETLASIRVKYPGVQLIVFATPISSDLLELYDQLGALRHYRTWLCQMASQSDRFYNFMGHNAITNKPSNFADAHHPYGTALKELTHCISGSNCPAALLAQIRLDPNTCPTTDLPSSLH